METRSILAETENYVLRNVHEACELLHRNSNNSIDVGDHYGDPVCGLIAPDEAWCITGGEGVILWTQAGKSWTGFRQPRAGCETGKLQFANPEDASWLQSVTGKAFQSVHAMKIENPTSLRILLDPWDDFASTWRLDIVAKSLTKLKDGPNCQGQPWTDAEIEF